MSALDDRDLARLLGELEGRLHGMEDSSRRIEEMLARWESQHNRCRLELDARVRDCERGLARATGVASFIALIAALIPQWIRGIWR